MVIYGRIPIHKLPRSFYSLLDKVFSCNFRMFVPERGIFFIQADSFGFTVMIAGSTVNAVVMPPRFGLRIGDIMHGTNALTVTALHTIIIDPVGRIKLFGQRELVRLLESRKGNDMPHESPV